MRIRLTLFVVLCAVLVAPAVATAEEMILQAQPKTTVPTQVADICDIFYVCSLWHEVSPVECRIWHVVYCGPLPDLPPVFRGADPGLVGRELTIESRTEVRRVKISAVTPQFHFASGVIVEPRGEWNPYDPAGEEWRAVKGVGGSLHVVRWQDNGDGQVGIGDRVDFAEGGISRLIADVRLGVHVEVLESTPREPVRGTVRHE